MCYAPCNQVLVLWQAGLSSVDTLKKADNLHDLNTIRYGSGFSTEEV